MKNNIKTALTLAAAAFTAMPVAVSAQTPGKRITPRRRIKPRKGAEAAGKRNLKPRHIGNRTGVGKRTLRIKPRKGRPVKRNNK